MILLDRFYLRVSRLPELSSVEKDDKKRILSATRWKIFRHWQHWIAFIAIFITSVVLSGVIAFWYLNIYLRLFSQPLMALSALLSLGLLFLLTNLGQNIKIYYLSPHIIKVLPERYHIPEIQALHSFQQELRKKALKKGLLIFGPSFFLFIILIAVTMRISGGSYEPLKMPAELSSPRVITNSCGLTKVVLIEDGRIGSVTDIVVRRSEDNNSWETILAGTTGALISSRGLPAKFISFDKKQDKVNFVKIGSQNVYGFMNRGSWCCEAHVMDVTGHTLWNYGREENGVNDMASGDLNGEGNPVYVVGFNGGGGIHLLNSEGQKLWEFADGNVWHVEIADIDGSGHKKIVHSNAGGEISVRDINGKIISKHKPKLYFSHFSLIRWPNEKSPERFLFAGLNKIWIFDEKANPLAEFDAPFSGDLGEARGVPFKIDKKPFLATIVDYENWHRSLLYVHTLSGQLIYQEVLSESCSSIAFLPISNKTTPGLELGCEGKIYEYQM
jgi:hypothetical protein